MVHLHTTATNKLKEKIVEDLDETEAYRLGLEGYKKSED